MGRGTGTCKKQLMGRSTFFDRGDRRCGKSGKRRYKRWKGAPFILGGAMPRLLRERITPAWDGIRLDRAISAQQVCLFVFV
jgi:hypothetical protein